MTVPNFLASSFYYSTGSSPITDVATIITDVRTILTSTNNPPWTEPVAGTFQSPVDSAGRFMRVILSKTATTRLAVTLQDQNLLTLFTREMDILATASVSYYTGQYHFILESENNTAIADHIYCWMLDPSPYALGSLSTYVLGNAYRGSTGSADSQSSTIDQFFMLENFATTNRERLRVYGDVNGTVVGLQDFQGNPQIFTCDIHGVPTTINVWCGKLYQAYMVPTWIGAGAVKKIALDDGTLASFRVLRNASVANSLIAVRVA